MYPNASTYVNASTDLVPTFAPCFSASLCFEGKETTANAWISFVVQLALALVLLVGQHLRPRKIKEANEVVGLLTGLIRMDKRAAIARQMTMVMGSARNMGSFKMKAAEAPDAALDDNYASDDGDSFTSKATTSNDGSFTQRKSSPRRARDRISRASKRASETINELAERASDKVQKLAETSHSEFKRAQHRPQFFTHVRNARNFHLPTEDPRCKRPPTAATGLRNRMFMAYGLSRGRMYKYLLLSAAPQLIDQSLGLSLLSGALSSVVSLVHAYGLHVEQLDGSTHLLELVAYLSEVSGQILSAFNFFPVFLLFGFLTYVASLWRRFVEMGTYVQGKIHKTAILAGGAVVDPACEKTKARMWKLYRYLNVAHLLCYYNIAPHLHKSLELDGLVGLGLLTHSELRLLLPHKNKMRDTMCGWSMALLQEGVRKGQLGPPEVGPPLLEACADFRGYMGWVHDLFDYGQPNLWSSITIFVVDLNVVLLAIFLPFRLFVPCTLSPFPWATVIGVFTVVLAYWASTTIMHTLANPFNAKGGHDMISADALITSSEQKIFSLLRVRYDGPPDDDDDDTPPPLRAAPNGASSARIAGPIHVLARAHAAAAPPRSCAAKEPKEADAPAPLQIDAPPPTTAPAASPTAPAGDASPQHSQRQWVERAMAPSASAPRAWSAGVAFEL